MTDDQVRTISEFAALLGDGIEEAEQDFQLRRQLIEALDVQATLCVEEGQQVVWVSCNPMGKNESCTLSSSTITCATRLQA